MTFCVVKAGESVFCLSTLILYHFEEIF